MVFPKFIILRPSFDDCHWSKAKWMSTPPWLVVKQPIKNKWQLLAHHHWIVPDRRLKINMKTTNQQLGNLMFKIKLVQKPSKKCSMFCVLSLDFYNVVPVFLIFFGGCSREQIDQRGSAGLRWQANELEQSIGRPTCHDRRMKLKNRLADRPAMGLVSVGQTQHMAHLQGGCHG